MIILFNYVNYMYIVSICAFYVSILCMREFFGHVRTMYKLYTEIS